MDLDSQPVHHEVATLIDLENKVEPRLACSINDTHIFSVALVDVRVCDLSIPVFVGVVEDRKDGVKKYVSGPMGLIMDWLYGCGLSLEDARNIAQDLLDVQLENNE